MNEQIAPRSWPSHSMLGMRLDYVAASDGLNEIIARASRGEAGYCAVSNVHQCVLAHDDLTFRSVVNGADLVLTDSMILQRSRSMRYAVARPETLRGAEMMLELCWLAEEAALPVALFGSRDEAALQALQEALYRRFPALRIVFAMAPPFRPMTAAEDAQLIDALRRSGARLVLVGLGCPKQERWMAAHQGTVAAMAIGLGAAFDFVSGRVRTSPQWVHSAGLEWLYRLLREPRRLGRRYLGTSPRFVWLLLVDALKTRRARI